MRKRREAAGSSSITDILRSYIKVFSSELKTRLLGVSNKSWGVVVYEKGIVTEVIV
jgi:hypothetical protein